MLSGDSVLDDVEMRLAAPGNSLCSLLLQPCGLTARACVLFPAGLLLPHTPVAITGNEHYWL